MSKKSFNKEYIPQKYSHEGELLSRRKIAITISGSPQYGCYAANLAASIRYNDPDLPIHLVHTAESIILLTPAHLSLFSSMAVCPAEAYTTVTGATQFIKAKTWMYELSPYDETIFIDVDAVIFPSYSIADIFTQLSEVCDFTIQNRGYTDLSAEPPKCYCIWCDVAALKKHYNIKSGRFYLLASEFVFFKKTKKNKAYFDMVRELYDQPTIAPAKFDTGIPDEYCFDIATTVLKYYPYESNKVFIYWHAIDQPKNWSADILKKFIGFSLGGNVIPPVIQARVKAYNKLFCQKLKLPFLFTPHNKKSWNKNRTAV